VNILIKVDSLDVQRLLRQSPQIAEKSLVRTLNRTADKARVAGSRAVRETYNIKAGDLRKSIRMYKASRSRMEAQLSITGKPVGLIAFAAKQTIKGVAYKILKAAGRKRLPHAFIAKMKTGHIGVFERSGSDRLPIEERKFITMPSVWQNKKIMAVVHKVINTELVKEWQANWDYYWGQANK